DALRARCEAIAKRKWTQSPEISACDQALLFNEARFPWPYLARGRRLVELGRLEEAEADFNEAVELAPNDPDVLAARAVFLADSGKPDRAAADFHAALNLFGETNPQWRCGQPIMQQAALREEAFERL